jgi:Phage head-tail joining protein
LGSEPRVMTYSKVKIVNGRPQIVGAFRHQVTIKAQGPSSPPQFDGSGNIIDWHEVATGGAHIEAVRGFDVTHTGHDTTELQAMAQKLATITMYYDPAAAENMCAYADTGVIYVIQSVEDVEFAGIAMVLTCQKVNP